MKKIVRVLAVVLAIAMLVSVFAGCHKKNEIAYTIGGREFTSAMYSCVLYTAATNARSAIYDYVKSNEGDTEKIKYKDYKFDSEGVVSAEGTPYEEFVENEAVRVLRQYAAVLNLMEEKGITLDAETEQIALIQASSYWYYGCDYNTYVQYSQNGYNLSQYYTPYGYFFEPNGVALSTYEQYMLYEYSYNYLFYELYGEDGEKAIPQADLDKYFGEHYALADIISYSLTDGDADLSEEDKKVLTDEANAFLKRLEKGESFDVIYKEFQANEKAREEAKKEEADKEDSNTENKDDKTEDKTDVKEESAEDKDEDKKDEETKDEGYEPAEYTTLLGDEDTDFATELYDIVKEYKINDVKIHEDKENKVLYLIMKRDLFEEDGFWLDYEGQSGSLRDVIIYNLKHDEFDADVTALGTTYDAVEDKFATRPFDVKDLVFDIE